ncbi:MAG: Cys-tRNA(Pro) deacylase [Clostridia bacterium]|nr:Cys-tRNA(Pro) deacylase [Clostridia bacterium]
MTKTNALRLLETAGIPFECSTYEVDEDDLSGTHAAELLGIDPDCMFKTLVCHDDKGGHEVFCIPVAEELDLKKCAVAAGVKRVEMIHVKELLPLTGYIRGGCSPVGMKKKFPTYIHETAIVFDEIYVSAGQRGLQMKVNPEQLAEYVEAPFADLTKG